MEYLKGYQQNFMQEDTKVGMIQDYLDNLPGDIVCSRQLYVNALHHEFGDPKQWEIREINNIMNTSIMGWKAFTNPKTFPSYGRQRGWQRTEAAMSSSNPFIDEEKKDRKPPEQMEMELKE